MACFSIRPSLISFFVLMFLLFATFSYASNKVVDVDVICKKTMKNPSFCSNILNSKPDGAAGADLISLANYTIDIVRGNITNTINLIKLLMAQSDSDDPNTKDHYKKCLSHFDYDNGALADIDYTQEMLKSGDYGGVNTAASAILSDVEDCVSGESPTDLPYHDTSSKLPQYVDVIEQVIDIILIISNYLVQN